MDVTDAGMVTDVKLEQQEKTPLPMDVTDAGMVTDVKLEQQEKTHIPMEVRFVAPEISKAVKPVQFRKALSPLAVSALYFTAVAGEPVVVMNVAAVQPSKALSPMVCSFGACDSGTDVSPVL